MLTWRSSGFGAGVDETYFASVALAGGCQLRASTGRWHAVADQTLEPWLLNVRFRPEQGLTDRTAAEDECV